MRNVLHFRKAAVLAALLWLVATTSHARTGERIFNALQQKQITGKVTDASGEPLPGVDVILKGAANQGTQTDFEGSYSIKAQQGATLIFSYVGMKNQQVVVGGQSVINIVLQEDTEELESVVLTGSRTPARTITNSPLPIDVISSKDMATTGQPTLDKAMQYRIPSFNTVQTPVNDATSLLDPYEIRNLGPSRTLILINGKRKNSSALLYVQNAPGQGETGTDISAIPVDAIKSIQVLRDGASAQYGSDAIAGVVNIILKDNAKYTNATFRSSITSKGDGALFGLSVNSGNPISIKGAQRGFLNYTVDFSKAEVANRPGTVSAEGEAADFKAKIEDVKEFLKRKPDAGNINGTPSYVAAKFLINGALDLTEESKVYFDAAYVNKKVNSFANYRTPYWRTLKTYPYLERFFPAKGKSYKDSGYDGYLPGFIGKLDDFNATLGFKKQKAGWHIDASATVGGNQQVYDITDTHNGNKVLSEPTWTDTDKDGAVDPGETSYGFKYREKSPTNVSAGGTAFYNIIGNVDVSKNLTERISLGLGSEYRYEIFQVIEGDAASYEGGGTDSFAGNAAVNSGNFTRNNIGFYGDLAWDITDNLLINGTVRYENYSDFGDAFVWKLSGLYKLFDDKISLRASYSNGFRAPSLHQIYTQKIQYQFEPGVGITQAGFVNNVSPQAKLLGIPRLTSEKSQNATVGLGFRPNKNFSLTLDLYSITIKDRIILSRDLAGTKGGTTEFDKILKAAFMKKLNFFLNGIDTRTSGIDFVANWKGINLGAGQLGFNLAGNYMVENKQIGDERLPDILKGKDILGNEKRRLLFTSRPQTKWILGADYAIKKFNFQLNNTYFGKTIFEQQGLDENVTTEFMPKVVTDLTVSYNFNQKATLSFNVNNIFNVLPEWKLVAKNSEGEAVLKDAAKVKKQKNSITFNQRYSQMTYNGYHFSQLGTIFNLSLNYRF